MTPSSLRPNDLTVALIVPNASRRSSVLTALRELQFVVTCEFEAYPTPQALLDIARSDFRVVIIDLDQDAELAIAAIEKLCTLNPSVTVMAYSASSDAGILRRSMEAGAREFLISPLLTKTLSEAFDRLSARTAQRDKAAGKILVFVPAKRGVGVTTIAANFALSLLKESGANVVVVDLDFQLGEVASALGMTVKFSVVDALLYTAPLDRGSLMALLARHSSGLAVLGSPEGYNFFNSYVYEGISKLFRVLCDNFDYVVVDTGNCHGEIQEKLFAMANKLYLIGDMTFPSVRNAHRLVAFLSAKNGSRALEVVMNRTNARIGDIDENSATNALGRPISWRLPNVEEAAQDACDSGVPLAMTDSPISRVLTKMAQAACERPLDTRTKTSKLFSSLLPKTKNTVEI